MTYFTWKESGLTSDCESLSAIAARYEEAANLMRSMEKEGFKLIKRSSEQLITHTDPAVFNKWGFVSEEAPLRQLKLIPDQEF